jgi:hypothetical protein
MLLASVIATSASLGRLPNTSSLVGGLLARSHGFGFRICQPHDDREGCGACTVGEVQRELSAAKYPPPDRRPLGRPPGRTRQAAGRSFDEGLSTTTARFADCGAVVATFWRLMSVTSLARAVSAARLVPLKFRDSCLMWPRSSRPTKTRSRQRPSPNSGKGPSVRTRREELPPASVRGAVNALLFIELSTTKWPRTEQAVDGQQDDGLILRWIGSASPPRRQEGRPVAPGRAPFAPLNLQRLPRTRPSSIDAALPTPPGAWPTGLRITGTPRGGRVTKPPW